MMGRKISLMPQKKRRLSRCDWCYRHDIPASEWEQKPLTDETYKPMCQKCANRRLRNPYNALLPMRRITLNSIILGKIREYVDGRISFSQFNEQYSPYVWEAMSKDDPKEGHLAAHLEIRLAEMRDGYRSEEETKRLLAKELLGRP